MAVPLRRNRDDLLQWVGGVATTLLLGGAMLAVALAATLSPTVRRPPKLDARPAACLDE